MAFPAVLGTLNLATSDAVVNLRDASGMVAGVHCFQIPSWGTGGTVTFESTVDGTNYVAHLATPLGSTTQASSATAAGIWWIDASGLSDVRLRVSSTGTGTISIYRKTVLG